jgi:cell division protease FtsH
LVHHSGDLGGLLLQHFIFSQFRPKVIPYSEFIQAVMNDRVGEIEIGKDRITGKMRSGKDEGEIVFSTVRVDTDPLLDEPRRVAL